MSRGFWDPCHDWLIDAAGIEKPLPHAAGNELLDLRGWDAPPSEPMGPIFGDQRAGDVVAVAGPLLDRMARGHPVAVAIKQQAGEQARLRYSSASLALGGVAGEPRLNGIPQLPIDDWRVFAGIGPFLVNDLAPVDAVLQPPVQGAAREWLTTPEPAGGARPSCQSRGGRGAAGRPCRRRGYPLAPPGSLRAAPVERAVPVWRRRARHRHTRPADTPTPRAVGS